MRRALAALALLLAAPAAAEGPRDLARAIVAGHFGREPAALPDSTRLDDLRADALDLAMIVAALEKAFGGPIPEARIDAVVTVGDLVALAPEGPSAP